MFQVYLLNSQRNKTNDQWTKHKENSVILCWGDRGRKKDITTYVFIKNALHVFIQHLSCEN